MGTANLTAIKDRIAELTVVPKNAPKDRTGAERQRRHRQRRKAQKPAVTVMPSDKAITESQPRRIVPFVLLCAALAVAAVSGSFSIIGLTAVFAGSFWPIIAMGATLETAKLASVAWLGRRYPAPRALKAGVIALVVTLMGLNAIGCYGYLAKAHIDHAIVSEAQVASHQAQVYARKEVAAANVTDLDRRIAQVDAAVAESTRRGRTVSAMALAERQTDRRNALVADRARAASALASIEVESAGVDNERSQLTADDGPVRYLATLIGADDEKLMHWFVLAVALLLDPLAVALLLAASARE